jgi:hypothetical protein
MNATVPGCRRASCANPIPASLAGEQLCLDHFLDEAFVRTDNTLGKCREGSSLSSIELESMLSDALAIVQNLEEGASDPHSGQRDRMLELLLILANLHEYVAHGSMRLNRPA